MRQPRRTRFRTAGRIVITAVFTVAVTFLFFIVEVFFQEPVSTPKDEHNTAQKSKRSVVADSRNVDSSKTTVPLDLRQNPVGEKGWGKNGLKATELQQSETIKVMSYNIAHGTGSDGVNDLKRIGDVIIKSGAEVIGLQEVDNRWSRRSHFVDQAKWLSEYTGMHYAYGPNLERPAASMRGEKHQYGNAVLSKYPIRSHKNYHLSSGSTRKRRGNHERRGLLEVRLNICGQDIYFYSTHLGLSAQERARHAKEILAITTKRNGHSIVVGDFNAYPQSPEILWLALHFNDVFASETAAYTYPTPYKHAKTGAVSAPYARIDYIFSKRKLKISRTEVLPANASDHLLPTAEIVLPYKRR